MISWQILKHKITNPNGFNKSSIFYIGSNEDVY